jgi:hypothetical protein
MTGIQNTMIEMARFMAWEKKRNKPLKFSSTILYLNFEGKLHIL